MKRNSSETAVASAAPIRKLACIRPKPLAELQASPFTNKIILDIPVIIGLITLPAQNIGHGHREPQPHPTGDHKDLASNDLTDLSLESPADRHTYQDGVLDQDPAPLEAGGGAAESHHPRGRSPSAGKRI